LCLAPAEAPSRWDVRRPEPVAPHRTGPDAPGKAARLATSGCGEPYFTTSDEFRARIRSDNEKYGKVIRAIGAKLD